jgi:hypothetical protein
MTMRLGVYSLPVSFSTARHERATAHVRALRSSERSEAHLARRLVALLAIALVASCSSSPKADACTPGATVSCACAGGGTGAQTCLADGSGFEACECGDAGGSRLAGEAGVATLSTLSTAELMMLCDFIANTLGGYGATYVVPCDAATTFTVQTWASQAQCVSQFALLPSTCAVTLDEAEACISSEARYCGFDTPPGCGVLKSNACEPRGDGG